MLGHILYIIIKSDIISKKRVNKKVHKRFSGVNNEWDTPVSISNTAVKSFVPMVLLKSGRVGNASLFY